MPNWVFNTLTIQGPKDQIDSIKDRLNRPYSRLYKHSWNMETKEYEDKVITYSNPLFCFWNIVSPAPEIMDEYVEQSPRTKSSLDDMPAWHKEIEEIGRVSNDWYNWNCRNWGTKWDVAVHDGEEYSDTVLHEHKSEGEDQWLVYGFNTAWSPPVPAMIKLSELVPNCVLTLSFEEEQGWGGELEFVNGEITAESGYENKCRDCDAEDTLDYCDNDCGQICSKCNWLGEADLDAVAECQTHSIYLDDNHVPDYRMEQV